MADKTLGLKPVIGLVERSLNKLKERGNVLCYQLRDRRSRVMDYEFYFLVQKNDRNTFELTVSQVSDQSQVKWDTKHNHITLKVGPDKKDHHQIAELLKDAMAHLNKRNLFSGYKQESKYAEEVLDKMKKAGTILDYYFPSQNADRSGIDLYIISRNNKKVPIQVKSSENYQFIHMKRYPKIPSIVTKDRSTEKLAHLTLVLIKAYEEGKVMHL